MPSMDALWLQKQFEDQPAKSKSDLAKSLGLEPSAVSKILAGKRQIKAHEYISMCQFFGIPLDGMTDDMSKPIITEAGFAEHDDAAANEDWTFPGGIPNQNEAEKIKIFKLKENTMAPDFRMGEYIAADTSDQVPSPEGVFMISDGFGTLIRFCSLQPDTDGMMIKLSALDPHFEEQILHRSDFTIIGRVIGKVDLL